MKNLLLLFLATSFISACKTSASAESESGIHFRSLARGYASGIAAAGVQVARDVDEWRALWRDHTSNVIPKPEPPMVDWKTEMVVCVSLGSRPTGGYGVTITRLEMREEALRVLALEHAPKPDSIQPAYVTQPYHMVAVERRGGAVELDLEKSAESRPGAGRQ